MANSTVCQSKSKPIVEPRPFSCFTSIIDNSDNAQTDRLTRPNQYALPTCQRWGGVGSAGRGPKNQVY